MSEKSLKELIDLGLSQGISQVEAAGSPLHPFLIDETGAMFVLVDTRGGIDPMQLAVPAIKKQILNVLRCALVLDSRIGGPDGKKLDAILVMVCERNAERGEIWAQRYIPKGFFRKFRVEGPREKVADSKNFILAAIENA
jgi:hypothetical protein